MARLESGDVSRREFLKLVGAGSAGLIASQLLPTDAFADERPNILVIVADDLGYADLGIQGCKDVPTPNIDSIGRNGVRFTNGYVPCPVCSPTRAGLQTGRYQQRFGHEFNPGNNPGPNFGLPLTEITIANRLKKAGYATGLVGKWHLGFAPEFHPLKRGYDEFFGFLGGAHSYFFKDPQPVNNAILRGTEPVTEDTYLTDAFAREAVAFIKKHAGHPFFLMLCFNAIHTPMQATEKYLRRFRHISDPKRQTMAAMLSAMDDAVGDVLNALRSANIYDNTLIFFISDNGGPTAANASRNDPLSGYKGQVLEGGIRVPFLMQWRKRIPAGKTYDYPVIALDIHPTCVAAAGIDLGRLGGKPLDGVDLLPYVTGKKNGPPHEHLFWRYGTQSAVRSGRWKLVRMQDGTRLFDLETDIAEQRDLYKERPSIAHELEQAFEKWNSQLIQPLWSGRPAAGTARAANRVARRQQRVRQRL
ncbi:MAG: sulfatase [Armatimonadota bacterium]|nr:sulfatase [Armatimonadota bacterium]